MLPPWSLYFIDEIDKQDKAIQFYGIFWQVLIKFEWEEGTWKAWGQGWRLHEILDYVQGRSPKKMTWVKAEIVIHVSGEKGVF